MALSRLSSCACLLLDAAKVDLSNECLGDNVKRVNLLLHQNIGYFEWMIRYELVVVGCYEVFPVYSHVENRICKLFIGQGRRELRFYQLFDLTFGKDLWYGIGIAIDVFAFIGFFTILVWWLDGSGTFARLLGARDEDQ